MWKLQWCTYFQVCLLCVKRICGYLQHILLSFCCVLNLFSNALPDESNVWLTDSVRIVIAAAAIEPWVTHYLPRWSLSEGLSSWPTLTSTKHAMKPPEATLAGLAAFPDALTDREMTRAHRWFRFCAGARATCVEKLLKKCLCKDTA